MSEQNLASPSLAGPPREEQLRVLVEKWRTHVPERFGAGYGSWQEGRRSCADDLASLLAAVPSSADGKEICICAAVKTQEGLVIRGHRHHDALYAARQAFCTPIRNDEDAQGFITSRGRYVNREEGYQLQVAAGIGSCASGGYRGERLFSEDLY